MKKILLIFSLLSINTLSFAQHDFYHNHEFSHADTLRGMLRAERTCYDVHFYDLNIQVDIDKKQLMGHVDICYEAVNSFERMQIDLFENMEIFRITQGDKTLDYERLHNAVFIEMPLQEKGMQKCIRVDYGGMPIAAANAPWDGGFVWDEDDNGNPWVGVACEGTGASLWWPNKDHLSDEPDSMAINISVPNPLTCVANGNLRKTIAQKNDYTRYEWFVSYPINNYNVTVNIGDYTHFADTYTAADGDTLALDYYVMPYNLEKAKKQFEQVPLMLACYEQFFGKYPFWRDGYAMVETPYLGMEHQGAIAYGNEYMRGYKGGMIPDDMDWDYIIIHETGHEYWGNSISTNDHAEMWIHESFTTYMEALYVECRYSYSDAVRYLKSQRPFIGDEQPILGPLDVNFGAWDHSDHYFKGSWVLHTLRHAINDHELWFDILKSFYQEHQLSNVKTEDFIQYVSKRTGKDYAPFFAQYLSYPKPPKLLYRLKQVNDELKISCVWESDVEAFEMPIQVGKKGAYQVITPSTQRRDFILRGLNIDDFEVATDLFYVEEELLD